MTGVAAPLVKVARVRTYFSLGLYVFGLLLSAAAVGIVAGGVGSLVRSRVGDGSLRYTFALICVLLIILDLRASPFAGLTLIRQTCPRWFHEFGQHRAFVMWGIDIGLGVSTIRVSSLYWAVLVAAMALMREGGALLVLACYAGASGAMVVSAVALRAWRPDRFTSARMIGSVRRAKLVAVSFTGGLAVLSIWGAV